MSFDFDAFLEGLTSETYLMGAALTIGLALVVQLLGTIIGLLVYLIGAQNSRVLRATSLAYIWFFRAIPSLLLLIFAWNALPQVAPLFRGPWYSVYVAAVFALTLHESPMMAEVFRGGFLSVDPGQKLAAKVIGLNQRQTLWRVIIPQVIRVIMPPTGNQMVNTIKVTSLTSVIALHELLSAADRYVSGTFKYVEYYSAAIVYYLVIVSFFMMIQHVLEKRYEWSSAKSGSAAHSVLATKPQT